MTYLRAMAGPKSNYNLDNKTFPIIFRVYPMLAELEFPCGEGFTGKTFPRLR